MKYCERHCIHSNVISFQFEKNCDFEKILSSEMKYLSVDACVCKSN